MEDAKSKLLVVVSCPWRGHALIRPAETSFALCALHCAAAKNDQPRELSQKVCSQCMPTRPATGPRWQRGGRSGGRPALPVACRAPAGSGWRASLGSSLQDSRMGGQAGWGGDWRHAAGEQAGGQLSWVPQKCRGVGTLANQAPPRLFACGVLDSLCTAGQLVCAMLCAEAANRTCEICASA